MKAIICVPWRGGEPTRERNWELVRPYLEATGIPVYAGDSDPAKPFNRSEARNNALAQADPDWDVVIFNDADSLFSPLQYREALEYVDATHAFAYPCSIYSDIDPETGEKDPLSPNLDQPGSGCVVLHRDALEAIGGGWDERFTNYGYEDIAFGMLLGTLVGDPYFSEGTGYRLGHARTFEEAQPHPPLTSLILMYQSAWANPERAAMIAESVACQ